MAMIWVRFGPRSWTTITAKMRNEEDTKIKLMETDQETREEININVTQKLITLMRVF